MKNVILASLFVASTAVAWRDFPGTPLIWNTSKYDSYVTLSWQKISGDVFGLQKVQKCWGPKNRTGFEGIHCLDYRLVNQGALTLNRTDGYIYLVKERVGFWRGHQDHQDDNEKYGYAFTRYLNVNDGQKTLEILNTTDPTVDDKGPPPSRVAADAPAGR